MAKKLQRPSDDLSPKKAAKAWKKYLDAEVGGAMNRPEWEVLVPNKALERNPNPPPALPSSPKMQLYLQALRTVLPTLPILQQIIVGEAYGIHRPESYTQEQIAEAQGMTQQAISERLTKAEKSLSGKIRAEMARLVKANVRQKNESIKKPLVET